MTLHTELPIHKVAYDLAGLTVFPSKAISTINTSFPGLLSPLDTPASETGMGWILCEKSDSLSYRAHHARGLSLESSSERFVCLETKGHWAGRRLTEATGWLLPHSRS